MALIDGLGRQISYVRMSVTDRCDFRCVYCMAEHMRFLPRAELLTSNEMVAVADAFVSQGVSKIRLTGGEPLLRPDIVDLVRQMAQLPGLNELTLTTNGSHLAKLAQPLRQAGLRRINVSLDSLHPDRFRALTRTGNLADVLAGIAAAQRAGFDPVKLNSVILRGRNDHEILDLVRFARQEGLDISFIEEMPLGHIQEHNRFLTLMPSSEVLAVVASEFSLTPSVESSGGPSRYYRMANSSTRIGLISPHSQNFCASCNRVRVAANGRLLLCLGNEVGTDLRELLREHPGDRDRLVAAIHAALQHKPARHEFNLEAPPQIVRFMNMTGG